MPAGAAQVMLLHHLTAYPRIPRAVELHLLPDSMKNLPPVLRSKAIEIANALL